MPANKPLLLISRTDEVSPRNSRYGFGGGYSFPSKNVQKTRIQPKLTHLNSTFENKRILLQQTMDGFVAEMVLVLEIIGTLEDFYKAVKKTPEMEWLAEFEEEDIEPDEYFHDQETRTKQLGGRLYMIMTNLEAMNELVRLWNKYKNGTKFKRGLTKWRHLFSQLKDIRFWNLEDRIKDTGFEKMILEFKENQQTHAQFEIELWFRKNHADRDRIESEINLLLSTYGGEIISKCVIEDIAYHALLIKAPIECFENLTNNTNVQLLNYEQIMFFRPLGHSTVSVYDSEIIEEPVTSPDENFINEPIAALLDGLPIQNHELLRDRVIIDDPDNFEENYATANRNHGTAMASLILNGDLNENNNKLPQNKLYVRPILQPNINSINEPREEIVPVNFLPIDLVHKAVKRIFEGDNGQLPVAPTIKIINLSVADLSREFNLSISPWARLLDWLSVKYNVLFIVCIGNCNHDIQLSIPRDDFTSLTPEELKIEVVKSIFNTMNKRRILSPSESINSISVGSAHFDNSTSYLSSLLDVFPDVLLPSPINRNGYGFRRSIKPDILMPGGRHLYREKPGNAHNFATLNVSSSTPYGNKVACPGTAGSIKSFRNLTGTSNATALGTRLAILLYENLKELRTQGGYTSINDDIIPVLLKALIIHGASWLNQQSILSKILEGSYQNEKIKEIIACFFGYGFVNPEKLFHCEDYRTTLIGVDELAKDQAHNYEIPIPNLVNGLSEWKRLTLTLAWLSPVNTEHNKYRKAQLWYNKPDDILKLERIDSQFQHTQRGTVQHEIYEGSKAVAFETNSNLTIKINCKEDAGKLTESVKYAFIVTLETKDEIGLNIYEEIKTRIRTRVRV